MPWLDAISHLRVPPSFYRSCVLPLGRLCTAPLVPIHRPVCSPVLHAIGSKISWRSPHSHPCPWHAGFPIPTGCPTIADLFPHTETTAYAMRANESMDIIAAPFCLPFLSTSVADESQRAWRSQHDDLTPGFTTHSERTRRIRESPVASNVCRCRHTCGSAPQARMSVRRKIRDAIEKQTRLVWCAEMAVSMAPTAMEL